MADKATVGSPETTSSTIKTPDNLVIVNPEQPLYSTEHLCIYLSELPELSPDGQVIDSHGQACGNLYSSPDEPGTRLRVREAPGELFKPNKPFKQFK